MTSNAFGEFSCAARSNGRSFCAFWTCWYLSGNQISGVLRHRRVPDAYPSPSTQEKKSKKRHRDSSDKKSSKKKARYADAD